MDEPVETSASTGSTGTGITSSEVTAGGHLLGGIATLYSSYQNGKTQAASYKQQANILNSQAGIYNNMASAYARSAKASVEIAKANAREHRLNAANINLLMDEQLAANAIERRAKIGNALAGFAANGVLIENRDDAAVEMWQRDEYADAAVERLNVIRSAANEAHNHFQLAKQSIVQGYSAAASAYGSAANASGQALSSLLQASSAMQNAAAARKTDWGSVLSATSSTALAIAALL